jgi:DNA-directed RNA polymerase subunit RPC12/RpoP
VILVRQELVIEHIKAFHGYCDVCARPFHDKEGAINHFRSVHEFKCVHCGKVLSTNNLLEEHVKSEHQLSCAYCGKQASKETELRTHIQEMHFKCPLCSSIVRDKAELELHIREVHQIKCPTCGIFVHEKEIEKHNRGKHSELNCRACFKKFSDLAKLSEHLLAEHDFKCLFCQSNFDYRDPLYEHLYCFHEKSPWRLDCMQCGRLYPYVDLREHLKALHALPCPDCGLKFVFQLDMIAHCLELHPRLCNLCSMIFASDELLQIHRKQMHLCRICGQGKALQALESEAFPPLCPHCLAIYRFNEYRQKGHFNPIEHSWDILNQRKPLPPFERPAPRLVSSSPTAAPAQVAKDRILPGIHAELSQTQSLDPVQTSTPISLPIPAELSFLKIPTEHILSESDINEVLDIVANRTISSLALVF